MRGQGAAIQPCNANVIRAGKIFGKKDSITYKVKTQERREYKGKKGKRVDMVILM
jgi:lipopolysaccharide export system protein LptA